MTKQDIDNQIAEVFAEIRPRARKRGNLRQYAKSGGAETPNPWCASGYALMRPDGTRLVYEALALKGRGVCVLRVYWDDPLRILHASKIATASTALNRVISDVARVFSREVDRLESSVTVQETAPDTPLPVADELSEARELAFFPVPPPIDLGDIPDAEPKR